MQNIIATLPLNPRHTSKLGFYGMFAYGQFVSAQTNTPFAPMFSVTDSNVADFESVKRGCDLLGISHVKYLRDDIVSDREVQNIFALLRQMGLIYQTMETVVSCACGKIQYLEKATLRKTKTSLVDGTEARCCLSKLVSAKIPVLMSAPIRKPEKFPLLQPAWVKKELLWFYDHMNHGMLVSRSTPQRYSVTMSDSGGKVYIDADTVLHFLPMLLKDAGYSAKMLISGVSTMKQLALMLAFCDQAGVNLPNEVHVLPRINYVHQDDAPVSITQKFSSHQVVNALLWCAMSTKQSVTLTDALIARCKQENLDKEHVYKHGRSIFITK